MYLIAWRTIFLYILLLESALGDLVKVLGFPSWVDGATARELREQLEIGEGCCGWLTLGVKRGELGRQSKDTWTFDNLEEANFL